jgi:hypothetical protein
LNGLVGKDLDKRLVSRKGTRTPISWEGIEGICGSELVALLKERPNTCFIFLYSGYAFFMRCNFHEQYKWLP